MRKILYLVPVVAVLIAGLGYAAIRTKPEHAEGRKILYYVDPMHPDYRSDKPGIAPDCGMALVPVYADEAAQSSSSSSHAESGTVQIDPATQQLYGIRLAKAESQKGQNALRAFGRVVADQTRVFRVNFGTDGYVKETSDDAVGNHVSRNQRLATVYSPEFLTVVGGYLSANERTPAVASAQKSNVAASTTLGAASAQARADRLRNLGMSDMQIAEISLSRTIPEDVYVVSPTDGFILSRSISAGVRFERYMEMYTIADLRRVWVIAEVFGKDAQAFRPGAAARVSLPDTGESFPARVGNVLPQIDPVTRTLNVRLEVDNPGFKLRPDMFVQVELTDAQAQGITVPAAAILDSGLSKHVFVQTALGRFEARAVDTGWRLNDRVQIVKGLREGETVVADGTFLVDSESRLQGTSIVSDTAQEVSPVELKTHRSVRTSHAAKMDPAMKMDEPMN